MNMSSWISKPTSQQTETEELRSKLIKLEARLDEVEIENFKYQAVIRTFESRESDLQSRLNKLEASVFKQEPIPIVPTVEQTPNPPDDNWNKLLHDEEVERKNALKKFRNQRRAASRIQKQGPAVRATNAPSLITATNGLSDTGRKSVDEWDEDDNVNNSNNKTDDETKPIQLPIQTATNPTPTPQPAMDEMVIREIDARILTWAQGSDSILDMLRTVSTVSQYLQFPVVVISDDEDCQQVRRAYLSVVRVCHPDKVKASSSLYRLAEANRLFEALSDAYNDYVINSA